MQHQPNTSPRIKSGLAALLWLLGPSMALGQAPAVETPASLVPAAFEACLKDTAAQLEARGLAPAAVAESLGGLSPDPRILAATQNQGEFVKPVWSYLDASVTPERIADGQAKLAALTPTLEKIETAYGVDRHVLVAIWGIESHYGTILDDPAIVRPVIPALATLTCGEPARAGFWRDELAAAIRIVAQGDIPRERMTGSWAGAMGHTQFMPTTYLREAVDFDGDGRRDLWGSVPDALASTASYLKASGWRAGEGWGREVALPEGFDHRLADETTERPLSEWSGLGLLPAGAGALGGETRAVLVLPAGARGPAFLLMPNHRAILRYNNALAYMLAVSHLADRLRGQDAFVRAWPRDSRPLSNAERRDIQAGLARNGYPVGEIDGKIGPKTRAAIRLYQAAAGLVPDGFADAALVERMGRAP